MLEKDTKKMEKQETTPEHWVNEYRIICPKHQRFVLKLQGLLTELLEINEIPYHTIEGRAKTIESFREKIQRPGKNYSNPLAELSDLSAIRIILYYTSDLQRVSGLLTTEFKLDAGQSSDKAEELALDQFGYLSVHKVISLDERRGSVTEWAPFQNIMAEVQLRTVLQHAWASISHRLQYKRESEIPANFRRKLVRLAGLLELADDQFAELNTAQSELKKEVSNLIASGEADLAIDRLTIQEFLEGTEIGPEIMKAVNLARFSDVDDKDETGWDQLLRVCALLRLGTLNDLKNIFWRLQPQLVDFFACVRKELKGDMSGDLPHWAAALLVGDDHGQLLTAETVPWEDEEYTNAIFHAGDHVLRQHRDATSTNSQVNKRVKRTG